jgi:phage replication O-like protein O
MTNGRKIFIAIAIFAIVVSGMEKLRIDDYVLDVLMRDLCGHDRSPSAFVVYLAFWRMTSGQRIRTVRTSHQRIAEATGLSKTAVQVAIKHLVRRRLLRSHRERATYMPEYTVLRPWLR